MRGSTHDAKLFDARLFGPSILPQGVVVTNQHSDAGRISTRRKAVNCGQNEARMDQRSCTVLLIIHMETDHEGQRFSEFDRADHTGLGVLLLALAGVFAAQRNHLCSTLVEFLRSQGHLILLADPSQGFTNLDSFRLHFLTIVLQLARHLARPHVGALPMVRPAIRVGPRRVNNEPARLSPLPVHVRDDVALGPSEKMITVDGFSRGTWAHGTRHGTRSRTRYRPPGGLGRG
mmetsp:Transcript_42918/g.87803  ORF Transcript_42918/g.87803 Transcript_42918/m.87803 type:complete len:232 (-) Transcript_42918:58-753(-)